MTPTWSSMGKGAKITLGIWILLFIYCTVMAVYKDHEDLVTANREAARTDSQLREKVRALSSPTEESKEKAHRKDVRQQLGKFLAEANTLLQTACAGAGRDCGVAGISLKEEFKLICWPTWSLNTTRGLRPI